MTESRSSRCTFSQMTDGDSHDNTEPPATFGQGIQVVGGPGDPIGSMA